MSSGLANQAVRPRSDSELTRRRIVAAAEQLFAQRGIDSVTLAEVGRAAEQKNRNAVQYHFGDKAGLLAAIRTKHAPAIEARRGRMLDELERGNPPSLRDLVEVLVRPVADEVQNPDGGAAYVQINAALIGHPEYSVLVGDQMASETTRRQRRLIAAAMPALPEELVEPRMFVTTVMVFHAIADAARFAIGAKDPEVRELFVCNLIDCTVGSLRAPVSARTRRACTGTFVAPRLPAQE